MRMRMRQWTVTLLAVLTLSVPAWAAEDGEQRGLLSLEAAEVAVAITTFLVLLVVLTKLGWKPILKGLQKREEVIRKALDDAQEANEEALALLAQYQEKMDDSKTEAKAIADAARKDAEVARRRIEEEAQNRAKDTLERSLREIRQAKDTALDDLLKDVASIATETASRIVRRDLTPEDNTKLVDDVVQDFTRSRADDTADKGSDA